MGSDPIKTIVVPTDCSQLSLNALRYADWLAARSGAEVIAVYGANFSRPDGEGVAAALVSPEDIEMMMAPVRRCIEEGLAKTLSAGTRHEIALLDCEPADAIVTVANERDADLIIMGTHDRNRLVRAVLGSVTDRVLETTNRPVLILREHNDLELGIRRIRAAAGEAEARKLAEAAGAEIVEGDADVVVLDKHQAHEIRTAHCPVLAVAK